MTFKLEKASRKKARLREAAFGPSGSGKTLSSLLQAKGIIDSGLTKQGRIAVIDTENHSAEKYAGHVPLPGGTSVHLDFDVLHLDQPTVDNYCLAIQACHAYPVLVIDSLSHGWEELLGEIDRLAQTKYRGNTHSAWSEGTPKQKKLIKALLNFPGHVIATMRSKTEWLIETQSNGKSKPVRVGLAPVQGKGIEYEFDLLVELAPNHCAQVLKDRTGKFQDRVIEYPGESFGRELIEWLNEGEDAPPVEAATTPPTDQFEEMVKARGLGEEARNMMRLYLGDVASRARVNNPGVTIDHIKARAIVSPDAFWKGFNDWFNKNDKPQAQEGGEASTTDSESVPEL